ncbi:hypothetical protein ACOSQ4_021708 [Xanthoceras sorbifolium]
MENKVLYFFYRIFKLRIKPRFLKASILFTICSEWIFIQHRLKRSHFYVCFLNIITLVHRDYIGEQATADNLFGVILGNRSALTGGNVIESGPNDTIFICNYICHAFWKLPLCYRSDESGYAFYCDIEEYGTCLGDVFSISWMEDSDKHDMSQETLQQQYEVDLTLPLALRSHVMQYGDTSLGNQLLYTYIGRTNPRHTNRKLSIAKKIRPVNQRYVELVFLHYKLENAQEGSQQNIEAEKQLNNEIYHRQYMDSTINLIATLLFGQKNKSHLLEYVRPAGQPLVDDWDCLKIFEKCGTLTTYGKKYIRAMANMCNVGINEEHMIMASTKACSNEFSSKIHGGHE